MEVCSAWNFIFIWIKLLFIWKILHETRFETKAQSNSQTGLLARINLFPVVDSLQVVSSWNDRMNGGAWAVGSSLWPEDDRCSPNTIQTCRLIHYFVVCRLKLPPLSVVDKSHLIFSSLVGNFFLVLSVVSNSFPRLLKGRLIPFRSSVMSSVENLHLKTTGGGHQRHIAHLIFSSAKY